MLQCSNLQCLWTPLHSRPGLVVVAHCSASLSMCSIHATAHAANVTSVRRTPSVELGPSSTCAAALPTASLRTTNRSAEDRVGPPMLRSPWKRSISACSALISSQMLTVPPLQCLGFFVCGGGEVVRLDTQPGAEHVERDLYAAGATYADALATAGPD